MWSPLFTEEYLETCEDWMPDSKDSCGHRRWKEWWKVCTSVSPAPLGTSQGETPSPLVTHHRWDCSGCINVHHCLLLGHVPCCCPAYSALLYGFWVATSWRTPEVAFCVPMEKPFLLLRVAVCTREAHRVFAGMWCRTQLLCGGHNPMQDPRRKERLGIEEEED